MKKLVPIFELQMMVLNSRLTVTLPLTTTMATAREVLLIPLRVRTEEEWQRDNCVGTYDNAIFLCSQCRFNSIDP